MPTSMTTCSYCGTNYKQFQSNCKNCGSPLPKPEQQAELYAIIEAPDERVPDAPVAPRQISNGYVWKLLFTDGWGISALVFTFMGMIFFPIGVSLTLGIITALVGIPFAGLGFLFFVGGLGVGKWRYDEKKLTVEVLRNGLPTKGEILTVEQNYNLTINNRHPWKIKYFYAVEGQEYEGEVSTLNSPGRGIQPGRKVRVLYLKESPQHSVIYPHP